MAEDKSLGVALVKEICPVCGKEIDGPIIMNTILDEHYAKEAEDLQGKAIGFANHSCEECAKHKDEALYIIGIDANKSDTSQGLAGFYRTGKIIGIKKECELADHLKDFTRELEDHTKLCFIEDEAGVKMGLWD